MVFVVQKLLLEAAINICIYTQAFHAASLGSNDKLKTKNFKYFQAAVRKRNDDHAKTSQNLPNLLKLC